jgi:hypothetical protein
VFGGVCVWCGCVLELWVVLLLWGVEVFGELFLVFLVYSMGWVLGVLGFWGFGGFLGFWRVFGVLAGFLFVF